MHSTRHGEDFGWKVGSEQHRNRILKRELFEAPLRGKPIVGIHWRLTNRACQLERVAVDEVQCPTPHTIPQLARRPVADEHVRDDALLPLPGKVHCGVPCYSIGDRTKWVAGDMPRPSPRTGVLACKLEL